MRRRYTRCIMRRIMEYLAYNQSVEEDDDTEEEQISEHAIRQHLLQGVAMRTSSRPVDMVFSTPVYGRCSHLIIIPNWLLTLTCHKVHSNITMGSSEVRASTSYNPEHHPSMHPFSQQHLGAGK